ncbi:MAG: ATP-dependent Clp protease ATP-binding subunit [bacterium]
MFENYTDRAKKALKKSKEVARRHGFGEVESEHLFVSLLELGSGIAIDILDELGIDHEDLLQELEEQMEDNVGTSGNMQPDFSPRLKRILSLAERSARELGHNYVGTEHLLIALADEGEGPVTEFFEDQGVSGREIKKLLMEILGDEYGFEYGFVVPSSEEEGKSKSKAGQKNSGQTPTLEAFARDLTELAREDDLDPVIGRNDEIERVIQILSRRKKNNPVLIGEPGVGKTAIVEGLAQRIVSVDVPEALYGKRVLALDLASIVAGTKYRGEFEQRMKKIIEEIQDSDDIIIFIDELHSLVGAGSAEGAIDAANILKPALARGEIQCIGATTLDEYRQYIEKDSALERRFKIINVEEPSVDQTIEILKGLRYQYENHHMVDISDEALEAAAQLSHRYLSDNFLPDIAIDVVDEAGSRAKLNTSMPPKDIRDLERELEEVQQEKGDAVASQEFERAADLRDQERKLKNELEEVKAEWKEEQGDERAVVEEEDVASLVSDISGIPVFKLTEKEQEKLLRMEEEIHERLVNQDKAVEAVSRAIRRARTGLKDPSRPMGAFMFLGPTGVGKTECAKALAELLFGDEEQMIRVDMSEFMEKHTVSRLVGAPPGYVGFDEGGQLTEQVRRNPYSVILLDEVEKAHNDVYNILLQIFEDGVLSDHIGHTVDFKNTIIIMTSNVGAREITQAGEMGFRTDDNEPLDYEDIKDRAMTELKRRFNPEFINRLDEIIVFEALEKDHLRQIIDLMLVEVEERLSKKGLQLHVTKPAKDFLIDKGYDPDYGARPLRRTIQRRIEDSLAEGLLHGKFSEGSEVHVSYRDGELKFSEEEIEEDEEESGDDSSQETGEEPVEAGSSSE